MYMNEESNEKQLQGLSEYIKVNGGLEEDMEELLQDFPIPLDMNDIVKIDDEENYIPKIKYDKQEFVKGVKEFSYLAGAFTALRNASMSSSEALSIIQMEIESKLTKKQISSQESIAKYNVNQEDSYDI